MAIHKYTLRTLPFCGLAYIELTDIFFTETKIARILEGNNFTKYLLRTVSQELTTEKKTCFYYDFKELNEQNVNLQPSQCFSAP